MPNKYTEFIDRTDGTYEVWNIVYNQCVGLIKKARMGTWMHWQLFSDSPDIGFSNGCLKEISEFITSLYTKKMICQHNGGTYIDQEGNARCISCNEIIEDAFKDCKKL